MVVILAEAEAPALPQRFAPLVGGPQVVILAEAEAPALHFADPCCGRI